MKYYVYELIDPRFDAIFYVGKGKGSRCEAHEKDARKGMPGAKCDMIREILDSGERIRINRVAHFSDEKEAYEFERRRIEELGIENLTNIAPGGGHVADPLLDADKEAIFLECAILKLKRTRTKGMDIKVFVHGTLVFDTKERLEALADQVREVLNRRGPEWVRKQYAQRRVTVEFTA